MTPENEVYIISNKPINEGTHYGFNLIKRAYENSQTITKILSGMAEELGEEGAYDLVALLLTRAEAIAEFITGHAPPQSPPNGEQGKG